MQDDTFIFLDEFSDTELYVFLNKSKEKILKFIWKEEKIEIIGKYQEKLESCYNTELQLEAPFDLAEIGYDSVVYKVLSKIEEREEAGKRYAEYKRNLKKWIKYMKKYLKNNEYTY